MNFDALVRNLITESPDNIIYQGKSLSFHGEEGNPHTFYIAQVSIRPDYEESYYDDFPSPFGTCVIYAPSKSSSALTKEVIDEYYEDTETPELTHSNLGSLLIYNEDFSYDDLKKFGINLYSFKKDVDGYFANFKKNYPRATFTLTKEAEAIGLTYRGRFWFVGGKAIVSLWHFDKKICTKFLIPFFKNKFGIEENDIEFEVATYEENEKTREAGTGNYVSGSALKGKEIKQQPYEKEISALLAKLHSAPSGSEKEKVKTELKALLAKYKLDSKKYGISDEVLKSSEITAQKMLKGAKPDETVAQIRARQQTSESFKDYFSSICSNLS